MKTPYINELRPQFLSIHCLNFAVANNSPSRSQMMASHLAQHLVISGSEPIRTQSGSEGEFGKYTFAVKMPANGRIIRVIERYPRNGVGLGSLGFNPETLVIYENEDTKVIDCFSIPYYTSYHQFFGYQNSIKDTVGNLVHKAYIKKGTVFADTPANSDYKNYGYGHNFETALISIPGVAEDGIIIAQEALHHLTFKVYETRTAEIGSKTWPKFLYGDSPFPEIGDLVRSDGLLMAMSTYDQDLAPVEMGINNIRKVDYTFDKRLYTREEQIVHTANGPGLVSPGRIVDIKVISNNDVSRNLPTMMAAPFEKYAKALRKYYLSLIQLESELSYERKKKFGDPRLNLSPQLQNLLVEARAITNHQSRDLKGPLNLSHRRAPLDEYSITFVIEHTITPTIGYKLTSVSGDKGIICDIRPLADMPVDSDGNRAEIVMSADSTQARTNYARLYLQYFGAAARDITKTLRKMTGLNEKTNIHQVEALNKDLFHQAYNFLLGYYQCISPKQFSFFSNLKIEDKIEHLFDVLSKGVYNFIPIGNPIDPVDMVKAVEVYHRPTYGPIVYRGASGEMVTTEDKVRIGPMYFMLLDKIADDWSAIATGRLQHYGVLSPQTRADKFTAPFRESPTRTLGEAEARIVAGYCGREAIAEMMDRSNNPLAQRNINYNILNAEFPTNIEHVVDRSYIPLGSTRPLQLVQHIFNCAGFHATYVPAASVPKQVNYSIQV